MSAGPDAATARLRRLVGAPWPRRWLLAAFWPPFFICTYLAFAPSTAQPDLELGSVARHGFAFVFLTVTLSAAHYRFGPLWKPMLWLAGYGVFIEAVQAFLPYRSAELKDLAIDAGGIAIGALLYRWPVAPLLERWFRR